VNRSTAVEPTLRVQLWSVWHSASRASRSDGAVMSPVLLRVYLTEQRAVNTAVEMRVYTDCETAVHEIECWCTASELAALASVHQPKGLRAVNPEQPSSVAEAVENFKYRKNL
jgi:hypothetical protein